MSSAVPAILPPTSIGEAVRSIGYLKDSEFAQLVELISGPRGFRPTKDQFEVLEKSSPDLAINLAYLLAALSYLADQAERFEDAGQAFKSIFPSVVEDLDKDAKWGEAKSVAARRLQEILDRRESFKRSKKLNRLSTGFLTNAIGFASFVDIRPNFEQKTPKGPRHVVDLIPVVQMRITTDATAAIDREIVFQISEDGLKLLKDTVSAIEDKIEALKASNYFTPKTQS